MLQNYCEDQIEITYVKVLGKGNTTCYVSVLLFTSCLEKNPRALRMTYLK